MLDVERYYIGIDLGTSSVKTVLLNSCGGKISSAKRTYPFLEEEKGYLQRPEDWTSAITESVTELVRTADIDPTLVDCIGLSAQLPTCVVTDSLGHPVAPAITWCDPRADEIGHEMAAAFGEDHYRRTGVVLDGRYVLPMAVWLRRNHPEVFGNEAHVLGAKDYICHWLTGSMVTDPTTASGSGVYDLFAGGFAVDYLDMFDFREEQMPRVAPSTACAGGLLESARLPLAANTPVCVGAADSLAGVIGMGACGTGDVCMLFGSSAAIIALADQPIPSDSRRFFITPAARPFQYGLETDVLSTGSAIAWLCSLMQKTPEELAALAADSHPGANGALFFPYMAGGEQGALWDPSLSGGIVGLSLEHKPSDIARALLEGICYEIRRCLTAFEEAGYEIRRIVTSGAFTGNPVIAQLLADILGRELQVFSGSDASAMGAAYLAGIARDHWQFDNISNICGIPDCYHPGTTDYDDLYARHLANVSCSRVNETKGKEEYP